MADVNLLAMRATDLSLQRFGSTKEVVDTGSASRSRKQAGTYEVNRTQPKRELEATPRRGVTVEKP